jgi:glutamyl-tRNA reductase
MGAEIDVVVLGLSHRTAPVALRERLTVVPDQADGLLREMAALPGVREVAMLSTCNRVEVYAVAPDRETALQALSGELARRGGMAEAEIEPHLYTRVQDGAVHHLFRVASSLDSLVIGEPQILGQVKATHDAAVRNGTAGPVLRDCFERAFRVARRVRRETAIARNPVSVSSVAVELARTVFESFDGKRVLVVSAGKMADLATRALRAHGARITITNRTLARAEELAAKFEAAVHPWEDLAGALTNADIVIASTGAQRPVLTLDLLTRVQKARRRRPLFIIDIAMPRDVEPACGKLDGVFLYDIDNLQEVAAQHRQGRQSEAEQAEAIVEQELGRYVQVFKGRQLGPTVTAFRAHVLGVAKTEAEKLVASMSQLGEREKRAIMSFADNLAKKLLHTPQMALKKDAGEPVPLVVAVQRLFELQPAVLEPVAEPEPTAEAHPAAPVEEVPEVDSKKVAGQ